jgi:hypothetical protein
VKRKKYVLKTDQKDKRTINIFKIQVDRKTEQKVRTERQNRKTEQKDGSENTTEIQ